MQIFLVYVCSFNAKNNWNWFGVLGGGGNGFEKGGGLQKMSYFQVLMENNRRYKIERGIIKKK